MIRRIITTVGTSIIGNYNKEHGSQLPNLKDEFSDLEEKQESEWDKFEDDIEDCKKSLLDFLKRDKGKASAEVKSLDKIIPQYPNDKIEIYLLATDTILSRMAAAVIQDYYDGTQTIYFSPDEHIINGLQVKDSEDLAEKGFANLINAIQKTKDKKATDKKEEIQLILNVTGGYKAIIPILTILGQVMNVPVNYIYEDSEALIEIPTMPIGIDWGLAEELAPYINERGYIENNKSQSVVNNISPKIIKKLREYRLIKDSNKPGLTYEITGWGHVFREYVESNMSISEKNTTSHIVEYKMYEYFQNNSYKSHDITYSKSKVGVIIEKPDATSEKNHDGEIDILLFDNEIGTDNYDNYVAIEVKLIGTILGQIGNVKYKLKAKKLDHFIRKFGKDPKEVHYIIAQMFNGVDKNNSYFVSRMKILKDVVHRYNYKIKFKAFLFTIGDPTDEKVYQNLFRRTITKDDLQKIQIPEND